ncbi:MAG: glycosyltransferase [Nitrososphaerales archaeon]
MYEEGEKLLKERYTKFKNIHFKGFVTEEEKRELLDRAWILLNTSAREGLPMSFLEAGAHGLAIISNSDPDGYTSMFGKCVKEKKEFVSAIQEAVRDEWYKDQGRKAYEYMKSIHDTPNVIEKHEQIYRSILDRNNRP